MPGKGSLIRFGDDELLAEMRELAGQHERSLAGEMRAACRQWVAYYADDAARERLQAERDRVFGPGFSVRVEPEEGP